MNERISTAPLLSRRLDRLRSGAPPPSVSAVAAAPTGELAGTERARRLADELGGKLLAEGGTAVVALEAALELPLSRERLARLPFPVDAGHPLVCLDLETTGLGTASGTLPFLIGLGSWQGERLTVRQLVLPDQPDEPALLQMLCALLPVGAWLVTYNGRSFDWPLLVSRFRLHRRVPPPLSGHLDLLPVARRLWKHRLGDARLATVERGVAGVARGPDLPGALIPERYFSYLRLDRPRLLHDVVAHNRQDIVSLARLLHVLASELGCASGWRRTHPGDLAGLARAYTRSGRHAEALGCLEAALDRLTPGGAPFDDPHLRARLAAQRALALTRLGRRQEAAAVWRDLALAGGRAAGPAWIRVARHHEHFERDLRRALQAAEQAERVAARARQLGRPLVALERDLAQRLPRLRRRLASSAEDGRRRPTAALRAEDDSLDESVRERVPPGWARTPDPPPRH